jgi:fermentation-respiration switch protein FrsA (DUF1100 family)
MPAKNLTNPFADLGSAAMNLRIALSWLILLGWAMGDEPKPAPKLTPAPAGGSAELTKLAEFLLGKNGGNQLFYFPTHDVPGTPGDWGFNFENVNFKSKDGTPLHGWFVPVQGKTAKSKATVVFSHGNAGSIGHHLGFILWFVDAGYNVLTYDYRGFGKSGGKVDRRGMLDDVRAAFDYVILRPDVNAERLVSFGHSLGGAKSLVALSEAPVKGLRAVITDAAFASYRAMAEVIAGKVGGNLVTDEWAPKDSVMKIAPVPLLIVHGTNDEVVPVAQGRQLFAAAAGPKTLFEVKGGHHGDSLTRNDGAYRKKVLAWLAEQLPE